MKKIIKFNAGWAIYYIIINIMKLICKTNFHPLFCAILKFIIAIIELPKNFVDIILSYTIIGEVYIYICFTCLAIVIINIYNGNEI